MTMSLIGSSLGLCVARIRAARLESQLQPGARRPRVVFLGDDGLEPTFPLPRAAVINELRRDVRSWSSERELRRAA